MSIRLEFDNLEEIEAFVEDFHTWKKRLIFRATDEIRAELDSNQTIAISNGESAHYKKGKRNG